MNNTLMQVVDLENRQFGRRAFSGTDGNFIMIPGGSVEMQHTDSCTQCIVYTLQLQQHTNQRLMLRQDTMQAVGFSPMALG